MVHVGDGAAGGVGGWVGVGGDGGDGEGTNAPSASGYRALGSQVWSLTLGSAGGCWLASLAVPGTGGSRPQCLCRPSWRLGLGLIATSTIDSEAL
jgi:hypothetical protein